ncbi:ABC transporter ATP-binding protein [Occultella glacieicola]|uniref:ABC transporter ATP-binding protein n=1 Tax=Occultella glacieicola TaxID=2518684 RepID=A0ABY2E3A2_9MICO|nr:ABC transporter ATP-binding protein [Occultella glacieicola]TDE92674.1 ABC transporter ATP-binding protein [Occultella glacieicola]
MTHAARFHGVSQVFGDFTAVDNIDLDIPDGKLTTLLGPSGCGKTTSLRMLAGYLAPTRGTISIAGVDSTRTPPERRNLGMVFQSYALFPHMSVADNVGFGLKMRRVPAADRARRVTESLELVGLAHLSASKPKKLSGGQQQRVALARAIAIRPKLLLLDEPLSNLDARLRIQMRAEIRRIQAETGLAVVLVTHDQDEALEMSDEMVLMKDGRIQQQGTPQAVFPAPANRFVAEFLGYENFLTDAGGATTTIRPEHLALSVSERTPAAETGAVLPGVVLDVAYRGVDVLVTVASADVSGARVELLADLRAESAPDLTPGADVWVHVPATHLVPLAAD